MKASPKGSTESYERVGLFTLTFKNWQERKTWFMEEYEALAGEEVMVTLL